jgi:hypothetical protein
MAETSWLTNCHPVEQGIANGGLATPVGTNQSNDGHTPARQWCVMHPRCPARLSSPGLFRYHGFIFSRIDTRKKPPWQF